MIHLLYRRIWKKETRYKWNPLAKISITTVKEQIRMILRAEDNCNMFRSNENLLSSLQDKGECCPTMHWGRHLAAGVSELTVNSFSDPDYRIHMDSVS